MPAALSQLVVEETKHLISTGVSQTEAANKLGVSVQSAHRIAKNHRKEIESLALDLINESIPLIKANHINTLTIANHVLSKELPNGQPDLEAIESNKTILTLADKKEYRALQVMGICPSNTPSIIINQLFSKGSVTVIDPGVQAVLGNQLDDLMDDTETVEGDYTDVSVNTEGEG